MKGAALVKLCHVCHKPCVDTYVTLTDLNLTFHALGWNSCYDQYEGKLCTPCPVPRAGAYSPSRPYDFNTFSPYRT